MKTLAFYRSLGDGSSYLLGNAVWRPEGWRFYPRVGNHKPSRKAHRTFEACLPRWVGYPDHCESKEVT